MGKVFGLFMWLDKNLIEYKVMEVVVGVCGVLLVWLMFDCGGIELLCVLYEVCFFVEFFLYGMGFLFVMVGLLLDDLLCVDVEVFLIDDIMIIEIDDVFLVEYLVDGCVWIGVYIVVLVFGIVCGDVVDVIVCVCLLIVYMLGDKIMMLLDDVVDVFMLKEGDYCLVLLLYIIVNCDM